MCFLIEKNTTNYEAVIPNIMSFIKALESKADLITNRRKYRELKHRLKYSRLWETLQDKAKFIF